MPAPLFQKGKSGNPSGRPKDPTKELSKLYAVEAIERLVEWMRSDNAKASVSACNVLLERGYGRAETTINLGLNDDIAGFLHAIGLGAAPTSYLELEAESDSLRDAMPGGNA